MCLSGVFRKPQQLEKGGGFWCTVSPGNSGDDAELVGWQSPVIASCAELTCAPLKLRGDTWAQVRKSHGALELHRVFGVWDVIFRIHLRAAQTGVWLANTSCSLLLKEEQAARTVTIAFLAQHLNRRVNRPDRAAIFCSLEIKNVP